MRGLRALRNWEFWLGATAAVVTLLVLINMALFEMNRRLQVDVNHRAQYIQESLKIEALNRELITVIAALAVRNNDNALKSVLTQHGIALTDTSTSPAPGVDPASKAGRGIAESAVRAPGR